MLKKSLQRDTKLIDMLFNRAAAASLANSSLGRMARAGGGSAGGSVEEDSALITCLADLAVRMPQPARAASACTACLLLFSKY